MPQQASKTIKQPFPIENLSWNQYKNTENYSEHNQAKYTTYYHALAFL